MLFQEVFSGVMSPIIQKLQNKLHRQCPAVSKQQAVDGAPTLRGQEGLCPGSGHRVSAAQTKTDVKYSSKNWQWHKKAVVHISLDKSFPWLCIQKVPN